MEDIRRNDLHQQNKLILIYYELQYHQNNQWIKVLTMIQAKQDHFLVVMRQEYE